MMHELQKSIIFFFTSGIHIFLLTQKAIEFDRTANRSRPNNQGLLRVKHNLISIVYAVDVIVLKNKAKDRY